MTLKEIRDLENELDTREKFADAMQSELNALAEKSQSGKLTKKDRNRVDEIADILESNLKFAREVLKAKKEFYRPATLVG